MPRIGVDARQDRRRRFIEAAWTCAAGKGFRDMTVDDVCAAAGASKGAFYGYFDSKRALMLALLEDHTDELDELMASLERRSISPVERLRRFTKAMLDHGADPASVQVRSDLWGASLTEPEVRRRLAEVVARRRAVLRGWVEQAVERGELVDVPANALASLILALGDGLMLHSAVDPSGFRWTMVARALDEIFAGLAH